MKRIMAVLFIVLAIGMVAGCSARYTESWMGPSGKATPVCDKVQPGLGLSVGDKEFIPVGYYTWRDVKGKEYREMVYVLRPAGKGGVK